MDNEQETVRSPVEVAKKTQKKNYAQVLKDSFSLRLDTLISEWLPVTETSLVVHVCTSCGNNWWTHTHTHMHLHTLARGRGVPQLTSQLDLSVGVGAEPFKPL